MIRFLIASTIGLSLLGAAHAATFVQKDRATLRALDKITGRSTDIEVKVGEPVVFGSLKVELKACYQTPPRGSARKRGIPQDRLDPASGGRNDGRCGGG